MNTRGQTVTCRRALTLLALGLALPVSVVSATGLEVDPSEGSIEGRVAISFWPTSPEDRQAILAPFGFNVHLVPAADLDSEVAYPCGKWFEPPPGQYKFWIEGNRAITPYSSVFLFRGGPFRGSGGVARVPVVPAGTVSLDRSVSLPSNGTTFLRLLHLDSHSRDPVLRREFSRRVPAKAAYDGAAMPAGRVIAALFDSSRDEYLGITRPVEVQAGATTQVTPKPPAEGSDLMVLLDRPAILGQHSEAGVEVVAWTGEKTRSPDVLVTTADRAYAVWYSLKGNHVEVEATSFGAFLPRREILLRPGKVEGFRGELQPLPNLDVEIRLPEALRRQDLELKIAELPDRAAVTGQLVAASSEFARFEALPPKELEVVLEAGPWAFRKRVDLRSGEDAAVVVSPTPIQITGRVFFADEPHAATVAFRSDPFRPQEEVTTVTDEDGSYGIVLFRSGFYHVGIQLEGAASGPYIEYLEEPIVEDRALDFHLPGNRFRVRAIDAQTGQGVAGASLVVDNRMASGRVASRHATTGDKGVAELPPLGPGEIRIIAEAEGYLRTGPVSEPVPEEDAEVEVTISLEPLGPGARLRVLLADGTSAAGAEVRAQPTLGNTPPVWSGMAGPQGLVEIPEQARGAFLLVRHPLGGGLVRAWDGARAARDTQTWTLPTAAPPLTVRVVQSWGDPVPWAQLAIVIAGVRLHGASLAWLASSPVGSTNRQGIWQGRNLPAQGLRVLAWASDAVAADVLSGAMDGLAEVIPYPWGTVVEVEALQ